MFREQTKQDFDTEARLMAQDALIKKGPQSKPGDTESYAVMQFETCAAVELVKRFVVISQLDEVLKGLVLRTSIHVPLL